MTIPQGKGLIVLAAATLGNTRLIDNVDVIKKDGED